MSITIKTGKLSSQEKKKFFKIVKRMKKLSTEEANLCLFRYLTGKISYNFKETLTREFQDLKIAQIWGYRYFTPELLTILIHEQLPDSTNFNKTYAVSLLANPAAVRVSTIEKDVRTPLAELFAEPSLSVDNKQLIYKVALEAKQVGLPQMRQIFNGLIEEPAIDSTPILVWTAQKYHLDDYPNDLVQEFLLNAHFAENMF